MSARKIDPAKLAQFLELLTDGHTIKHACDKAGVGRTTVYERREADEKFRAAMDEAVDVGIEALEQEARRRAVDGTVRPVTIAGERELVREYSDTLLVFLLKAKRPGVYREQFKHEHSGPGGEPIVVEHEVDASRVLAGLAELGLVTRGGSRSRKAKAD